jgi:hypothetical protein
MRTSSGLVSTPRNSQSCAAKKKIMTNDEHLSSDLLTQLEISYVEPSQTTIVTRVNDVKDLNDDDISKEMNKHIPLKDLNPFKVRLNYD